MARRKPTNKKSTSSRRSARNALKSGKEVENAASHSQESETPIQPQIESSVSKSSAPSNETEEKISEFDNDASSNQEKTDTDSQPNSGKSTPCDMISKPSTALHKKFGKYRCLFTNDETSKKFDVCSDSETSSSIEIKVIDLTCNSENESSVPSDCLYDTNSASQPSLVDSDKSELPIIAPITEQVLTNCRENSPAQNIHPLKVENTVQTGLSYDCDISCESKNTLQCTLDSKSGNEAAEMADVKNYFEEDKELLKDSNVEFQKYQQLEYNSESMDQGDDEVITIFQIVEEETPEPYSQMNSTTFDSQEQTVARFNEDFENLNLSQNQFKSLVPINFEKQTDKEIDCEGIVSDGKDRNSEILLRPDPSLTPSSTLSDDSNSSRTLEINQASDSAESSPSVRRSSRIKSISTLKQKTKGYGLVKTPLKKALMSQTKLKLDEMSVEVDKSNFSQPNSPSFPVPTIDMPVKVKSRWRRSSEMEMGYNSPASSPLTSPSLPKLPVVMEKTEEENIVEETSEDMKSKIIEERLLQFQHLVDNDYLCERGISKETKKMICDCFLTKEEIERGELGCGEDCLNRLLMIECNYRCPVGDRCTNRKFQAHDNAPLRVFYADKKGCGLEASTDIQAGEFLMEYVGEVLDSDLFYKRAQEYSSDNNLHHYFMALQGETVIDATMKGNISRFINHSCEPNAETQKWTVNGELRIGFFSKRDIKQGEEITFDYQFQRFGKEAQRCYCGAGNCRGWIGAEPDSDDDYDEEDDVSTSKDKDQELNEGLKVDDFKTDESKEAKLKARAKKKSERAKYRVRPPAELTLDADIEEDLEALARTGIKNQHHTLTLSRTMVRAKSRKSQISLLKLLREADLPCRRLFLDYRGLRLLSPWAGNAPIEFRLEMLQALDRLPIPNKTLVQESRLFGIVEKWLTDAATAMEKGASEPSIDEATGLPSQFGLNKSKPDSQNTFTKEEIVMCQKVLELSKHLLDTWSSLKEIYKIPKKERIQQMKEHERQANVERRAADSSGSRERDRYARDERDRERDRDRDRERDREREKERDRAKHRERERERHREREKERDDRDRRRRSPDGRRSIRLEERVLTTVPPVSKEERRRAFAEAAAQAERARDTWPARALLPTPPQHWQPDHFHNVFPPGMMQGQQSMMPGQTNMMGPQGNMMGMMSGQSNMLASQGGIIPGMMGGPALLPTPGTVMMGSEGLSQDWMAGGDFAPPFCPPFQPPQPFCMPPNMMGSGFGMVQGAAGGFMFPPLLQSAPGAALHAQPTIKVEAAPAEGAGAGEAEGGGGGGVGGGAEVPLPSMWRSARDARGRTYYYHVKLRASQWEPPALAAGAALPSDEEESSEEEEEEEEEMPLLKPSCLKSKGRVVVEGVDGVVEVIKDKHNGLIPDEALINVKPRKRRPGLVTERPISPRTEEDKAASKLEVKRYRETKEKLKRRKERLWQQMKLLQHHHKYRKKFRSLPQKLQAKMVEMVGSESESSSDAEKPEAAKVKVKVEAEAVVVEEAGEAGEEQARRIKEQFRASMARVMVSHLNPYRHHGAAVGRITTTADFKHLARKLTHFVMLKELKHCRSVSELECNDSVKQKAREFVRKYMAKFGAVYARPADELD